MIKTKTELITIENGIVLCDVKQGVNMTLEEGKENIKAILEITEGKRSPVLVDITKSKGITKECRQYYSSEEVANVQSAVAMIVDSAFTKMIANFFIGLNKTLFPLKMFTNKEEAISWLSEFK